MTVAIVLDNKIVSAPNIQSEINDQGVIEGSFTNEQANDRKPGHDTEGNEGSARQNPGLMRMDAYGQCGQELRRRNYM